MKLTFVSINDMFFLQPTSVNSHLWLPIGSWLLNCSGVKDPTILGFKVLCGKSSLSTAKFYIPYKPYSTPEVYVPHK